MHIHKIDKKTHYSFLEESRKDPITGDLIQANDEVVFCSRCKSAFLKGSWEYIKEEHCGQKHTLKYFPVSKKLLLNAPVIKPIFMTPLQSPLSIKEWSEQLSVYGAEEKKATIHLKSTFIERWKNSLQPQLKIKKISKPTAQRLDFLPFVFSSELKGQLVRKFKDRNNVLKIVDFSTIASVCFFPTMFTLIFLPALLGVQDGNIDKLLLSAIGIFWLYPISYLMYEFIKSKKNIEQQWKLVVKKKRKSSKKTKKLSTTTTQINNVPNLFGIFEDKFFLYDEDNNALFFNFYENETSIFYQSDKELTLQIQKQDGNNTILSLIFFSKQQLNNFLVAFAKQKQHFSDESKVDLMNFPPNTEKFLRRKLDKYKTLVFFKLQTDEDKKTIEEDTNKAVIQVTDLRKLKKSQKVSKQSQNRNRHHQNRQQTQYRNYRRR